MAMTHATLEQTIGGTSAEKMQFDDQFDTDAESPEKKMTIITFFCSDCSVF